LASLQGQDGRAYRDRMGAPTGTGSARLQGQDWRPYRDRIGAPTGTGSAPLQGQDRRASRDRIGVPTGTGLAPLQGQDRRSYRDRIGAPILSPCRQAHANGDLQGMPRTVRAALPPAPTDHQSWTTVSKSGAPVPRAAHPSSCREARAHGAQQGPLLSAAGPRPGRGPAPPAPAARFHMCRGAPLPAGRPSSGPAGSGPVPAFHTRKRGNVYVVCIVYVVYVGVLCRKTP
jgi:hypothetical protein